MQNQNYAFWVKLASCASLVAVSMMIALKTYAWFDTHSASLLASLSDSVFDLFASLMNFFAIRYSLRPPDEEHRFGHGKAEALAALCQAAFVLGASTLLIFHSLGQLQQPTQVTNVEVGMVVIVLSILITFVLVAIQSYALKRANSVAVKADSLHYRGDLFMNLGVLIALGLSHWGYVGADPLVAILIAGYLLFGAGKIVRESVDTLMDKEMDVTHLETIRSLSLSQPEVQGVHDIRTRQSGKTIFIQLHLELGDELPLVQAHKVGMQVEQSLANAFNGAEVLIHFDPVSVVQHRKEPVDFPVGQ